MSENIEKLLKVSHNIIHYIATQTEPFLNVARLAISLEVYGLNALLIT